MAGASLLALLDDIATLLRLVGGLLQPTQGAIRFAGDLPPQIGKCINYCESKIF